MKNFKNGDSLLRNGNRPLFLQNKIKRIAVILPELYLGGTLRGAITLVNFLRKGAALQKKDVEIVFFYRESDIYNEIADYGLTEDIKARQFNWKVLDRQQAYNTMLLAGFKNWEPSESNYLILDDGIAQLNEFDLLIFVSDRVQYQVLPLKPYCVLVYDYIQRYQNFIENGTTDMVMIDFVRRAQKVLVTTEFTKNDALQYAGVNKKKLKKIPLLLEGFDVNLTSKSIPKQNYILWTTNGAKHKNHVKALTALLKYYTEYDGNLPCFVTGVGTDSLLNRKIDYLADFQKIYSNNKILHEKLKFLGNVSNSEYRSLLQKASFLWHPANIDNGTFSVIEAASYFTPSLSSHYPAMVEINDAYSLNLQWTDSNSPNVMASDLHKMERDYPNLINCLPPELKYYDMKEDDLALVYWKEIEECL